MDSLLELDERNVCVSVCQLREKGARPENVFFAWYREKAEAVIVIGATKTFTYTCAFKWNVVLPSCIDMSIFFAMCLIEHMVH